MSEADVALFLQKVAGDPALQAEVQAAAGSQDPVAAIVAAAARCGCSFTAEEFTRVQDAAAAELSDAQLESVSGGAASLESGIHGGDFARAGISPSLFGRTG